MKFFNKIKGFTLAEIMITLTIIGIISAIIVPVALRSKPDENLIKFKKAHETLHQVIKTLVESDKYYLDGDLGISANGVQILGDKADTQPYFCETMADLLSAKKVDCAKNGSGRGGATAFLLASNEYVPYIANGEKMQRTVTPETIQVTKEKFDIYCKNAGKTLGAEIITTDDIVYYQAGYGWQFGSWKINPNSQNGLTEAISRRIFSPPDEFPANYADEQGFDISYKIFCIDVDGIPDNVTTTNCRNECPFGYGIRADGKILPGARAEEWLKKDISGKEKDEES